MTGNQESIDHVSLERLVEAGAVHGADVVGQPGGWRVIIKYGTTERVLAARRGAVRVFRKLETLVGYLRGVGISQLSVNAANYDPNARPMRRRPDASERMRRTHEAAEHDKWFRAQVEQALNEADDPNTQWVSNEEVKAHFAARRAEWEKRATNERIKRGTT